MRSAVLGAEGYLLYLGGIYQLVKVASPPLLEHIVQRWIP